MMRGLLFSLLCQQALKRQGRPSGLIGQYKPYLNSNDSPTRDILKDYSGQGHDIQLYNFAFSEKSGYGLYPFRFDVWLAINGANILNSTYDAITFTGGDNVNSRVQLGIKGVSKFKISVKGLLDGNIMTFRYYNGQVVIIFKEILSNGIYIIDNIPSEASGFYFYTQQSSPITIELIPDYIGALVSDGVDDYGLCENFPILTKEKGYTVVALRKKLVDKLGWFITNATRHGDPNYTGAFVVEGNIEGLKNYAGSFGKNTAIPEDNDALFSYQTSVKCNGTNIQKGDNSASNLLNLFRFATNNSTYSSYALYTLEIYNRDLTDEEIQSVKEAMYNEYLTATNALQNHIIADYECYDKTNEDEDRNVLKDLSGNGHDITLYNFGFAEGSGYGKYTYNFASPNWLVASDRANISRKRQSINVTSVLSQIVQFYMNSKAGSSPYTVPSFKIKVTGLTNGQNLDYRNYTHVIINITNDGVYTIPSFEFEANGKWYGFVFNKIQESCNVTIEQIPEHKGALVSDGINDFGLCENFPILNKEDGYTILAIRRILQDTTANGAFLINGSNTEATKTAFILDLFYSNSHYVRNFGSNNILISNESPKNSFVYQTTKSYNGVKDLTTGENEGNVKLNLFSMSATYLPMSAALYALKILDKDCTTEEIKFIAKQMVAKHKEKTGETIELNF